MIKKIILNQEFPHTLYIIVLNIEKKVFDHQHRKKGIKTYARNKIHSSPPPPPCLYVLYSTIIASPPKTNWLLPYGFGNDAALSLDQGLIKYVNFF